MNVFNKVDSTMLLSKLFQYFRVPLVIFCFYPGSSCPLVLSPCIIVKQVQLVLYKYLLDTRFFDPLNFIVPWQIKRNSSNLSPHAKFPGTMIILFSPNWIRIYFPVPLKIFKIPFEWENVNR